jgi:ubiquinone/menaquinone biosynthesis C-methylase UbiE
MDKRKVIDDATQVQRARTRANYDRLSRFYDSLAGSSERACREAGLRILGSQPGERLLEIGPGTGQALTPLAAGVEPGGQVIGLDLSPGMLQVARQRIRRTGSDTHAHLVVGDATSVPFPGGGFAGIFMAFTLELFAEWEIPLVLGECQRLLQPGGRLAVASLSTAASGAFSRAMLAAYEWAHRAFPQVIDCRPIPLQAVLAEAGFVVSAVEAFSMWGLPVMAALAVKI